MIIDARVHSHDKFRKYSMLGALAYALENMDDEIIIECFIDAAGHKKTIDQVRMSTNKIKDALGLNYMTRVLNGKLHVFKINTNGEL